MAEIKSAIELAMEKTKDLAGRQEKGLSPSKNLPPG